ncbi:DNA mismatch repair protein MutS [Siminovitchia terrae]|uniref:DNA mismatch repair protein MutS n=1 Tax=Siminovitchia terrae TaxID=1914933 RepID=A0A429XB73_SIMTE|nr:DNA mismatch repair protein MutS [Siminovitchia terrae]RST60611.1 DNA mismatch repair protein MutS [Siminovitchia terrae]GIN91198.1 DNA mismatch repair protein MutS [Siminovitchia terrae]
MGQQYTPMIQQYLKVKAENKDAFLFFRLGDFYELFFEDALKASQELEITLTSREGGAEEKIPMCGVPHHSAAGYIENLIQKGYKVAICEQTEDPKHAKGVVKREVVQLVTPGTVMDGKGIVAKENNYIAAIANFNNQSYGIAYTDLSTGEGRATVLEGSVDLLLNELATIGAKEVVSCPDEDKDLLDKIKERCQAVISYEENSFMHDEFQKILQKLDAEELQEPVQRLLHYLKKTQKRSLDHLQPFEIYENDQFMKIDFYSKRNLEITEPIRGKDKKGTLLWLLDETSTAMGGRHLRQWLDRPLISKSLIEKRLLLVELFMEHYFERLDLQELLKSVYDLERLAGRVAFGNANARDFIQLKKSLLQVPAIRSLIKGMDHEETNKLAMALDPCEELTDLLERSVAENPPISVKEGGIIKDGYNEKLDQYRDASRNGKNWIATLEKDEREKTGIKSLKVGYNRVFGYYIEVTRANVKFLEEGRYERKQTLTNAERFITPELKEKEALILQADERSIELEYDLFLDLRDQVKQFIPRLQKTAKIISEIDIFQSFAAISEARHYVKPELHFNRELILENGRHPVVEKVMGSQEYVPNDCMMDDEREMLLITGPNMSGKSTYMRQVALTAIMAQIGCFVPASNAKLPIFDQIFTRIGAADDLISGQSTFMVEMLEAKNAITHATQNSLILFDEIGRGTSTYDGMALAQAIIEYIHEQIGAKTLFSTHYHELTGLDKQLSRLKNVHVSAAEHQGKLVFLHKVKDGAADKSYGIHVAELAELPETLIQRAEEILSQLEKSNGKTKTASVSREEVKEPIVSNASNEQLAFFSKPNEPAVSKTEKKVLKEIESLNLLEMNPLQALNVLYSLQKKIRK